MTARMTAIAMVSSVACKGAPARLQIGMESYAISARFSVTFLSERSAERDDLAGIHDVLRIKRALDGGHHHESLRAVLRLEILHLALPHPVLAGTGSVHRQSALNQPRI